VRLPAGLDWWRGEPGGTEWLEALPRLAEECAEAWSLQLGEPFAGSHVSLVVPADLSNGTGAVLKLNFPDPESEHEADALAHWDGRGAVRLLAHDRERRALLVERCRPGVQLWSVPDEDGFCSIGAAVLRRLWRPAPQPSPYRSLAAEAERWADEVPRDWESLGRPFERALVDAAVAAIGELAPTQEQPVVLHQDFHGGNVLRAQRDGWLAIDPKPLVGERAFDVASLLRDRRWELRRPGAAARIARRLDLLTDELALDRERMRGWGIVHALAWGVGETRVEPDMVECARLLAEAR
jgi:streptomycin 6-kinase